MRTYESVIRWWAAEERKHGSRHYMNRHPEVLLCMERYKWMPPRYIRPELLAFERILDYGLSPRGDREEANTPREYHAELLTGKDPEQWKWIGDKNPAYVKNLDWLSKKFDRR